MVELDVNSQVEKEREKAEKKGDAREREKALNAIRNRLDRLDHLKIAIVSSPDLDDMVDSLALDPVENDEAKEGVWVGTIHAAKGLEFDHVMLPGWSDGVFPSARILRELKNADTEIEATARADLEEERRLAYVAITRGRKSVALTSVERFQEETDLPPSRFIGEISTDLANVKKTWI